MSVRFTNITQTTFCQLHDGIWLNDTLIYYFLKKYDAFIFAGGGSGILNCARSGKVVRKGGSNHVVRNSVLDFCLREQCCANHVCGAFVPIMFSGRCFAICKISKITSTTFEGYVSGRGSVRGPPRKHGRI